MKTDAFSGIMKNMEKSIPNLFAADTAPEALAIELKVLASLSMEDKATIASSAEN